MRFSKSFCALTLLALAIAGIRAYSQASVTENQTTYLYVNGSTGSDSHSGTYSSPLKTIQAAVNKANVNNQKRIGTKIIVESGVYRQSVTINRPWNGSSGTHQFAWSYGTGMSTWGDSTSLTARRFD